MGATVATLYFSAATSYDPSIGASNPERDPERVTAKAIGAIRDKEYADIRNRHLEDHSRIFNRVALRLGESKAPADMPADRRIAEYGSRDPGLVESAVPLRTLSAHSQLPSGNAARQSSRDLERRNASALEQQLHLEH